MRIQLIRHATLLLEIGEQTIIVDPMLSQPGLMDPAQNAENERRNPLVALPPELPDFNKLDAAIVTHTHRDHLDEAAVNLLPKQLAVFCQPEDGDKLTGLGFAQAQPIFNSTVWNGIRLTRTKGQHGTGQIGQRMGPVSGFVLEAPHEPVLYITGDTVWCPEVEEALQGFQPDVIVAFAGSAQFRSGGPITMNAADLARVCEVSPKATVIAAHMEAWNHCLLSRDKLREELQQCGCMHQARIPADGEWLLF